MIAPSLSQPTTSYASPLTAEVVSLRRLPYPYSAMMAICSDLDETPDRNVYWKIAQFLNTTGPTSMGDGAGLEVGNTIYFDMPEDQFSYWNTDDAGRDMVHRMIQSGHIDCLHSYGDDATTRKHAARALDALCLNNCRIKAWIDHAVAPTNFGADIMQGAGDLPGSPAYHADLTCGFGVRYVWRGRVTSVIGQNTPRKFSGIWQPRHPVASALTLSKEVAKAARAAAGDQKYSIHDANAILRKTKLRDGHPVSEFLRSNPCWGGVSHSDTGIGIPEVLTADLLSTLIDRHGTSILYTHLGKIKNHDQPLPPATCAAFRLLAQESAAGKILVTTTHRVLGYCDALERASIETNLVGEDLEIRVAVPFDIGGDPSLSELAGFTFYTERPTVRIIVNGQVVSDIRFNQADATGKKSVSINWRRLEFPQ